MDVVLIFVPCDPPLYICFYIFFILFILIFNSIILKPPSLFILLLVYISILYFIFVNNTLLF
ncbi:hypothetical protein RchiOBHm_Chr0c19g0500001 [Rosa chinensis]|uniref:Uncharacterized protein n=1 Tax=Rosa chinensis TaxID=74649 RepID=A0A2P6SQK2_ROSCH|nr:hypothetical protein RchiOBHm_Chr0c19g0500001 [Rosa chinensis]